MAYCRICPLLKQHFNSVIFDVPVDGMTENSFIISSESKIPSKGKCFLTWKMLSYKRVISIYFLTLLIFILSLRVMIQGSFLNDASHGFRVRCIYFTTPPFSNKSEVKSGVLQLKILPGTNVWEFASINNNELNQAVKVYFAKQLNNIQRNLVKWNQ